MSDIDEMAKAKLQAECGNSQDIGSRDEEFRRENERRERREDAQMQRDVRAACIDLVLKAAPQMLLSYGAAKVVADARVLADFIQGTNDSEVIAAARALAEKVKSLG